MSSGGGKILVIRGGAIGDFILTLPVFAALRRQFPEARLEVLGYPHIAQLALAGWLVDDVRSIEARALAGFFARCGALDGALASYFESFAVIFSYLYDPDGIFQENVGHCSRAQFIPGPHRPDESLNLHATEVFLKPLERLAIFDADPVPRLNLEGTSSTASATSDWLAMHPGSGSECKNWPEENWRELVRRLMDDPESQLLLVGGEAEGERLRRLSQSLDPARVQMAQSLPLVELAGRLRACAGFVGHDSGISHLAAALGVPSLILWGETNETVWRPAGDRVTVHRELAGLPALRVDTVLGRLARIPRGF